MFEEHENCLFENENNFALNENSVEVKTCINRESNSLDIIISLYSCYDEHEVPSSCKTTAYLSWYTATKFPSAITSLITT